MLSKILAGSAIALILALGGCATAGTNTYASTTGAVVTRQPQPQDDTDNPNAGNGYRVFPNDGNVTRTRY